MTTAVITLSKVNGTFVRAPGSNVTIVASADFLGEQFDTPTIPTSVLNVSQYFTNFPTIAQMQGNDATTFANAISYTNLTASNLMTYANNAASNAYSNAVSYILTRGVNVDGGGF